MSGSPANKNFQIPPPDASRPFWIYNRVPHLAGQENKRVLKKPAKGTRRPSFFKPNMPPPVAVPALRASEEFGLGPALQAQPGSAIRAPEGFEFGLAPALQPVLGFGAPPPVPGGIGLDLPLGPPPGEVGPFSVVRNNGKRGKLAHRNNTKPANKPANNKAPAKTRRSTRRARSQRKN